MDKTEKTIKIMWACSVIPLIIGILMMIFSSSITKYSTDEYWVAKDYHHVYRKYSGEIVDYIDENETCDINGDTIIVTETNKTLNTIGWIITVLFGMFTIGLIMGSAGDLWEKIKEIF